MAFGGLNPVILGQRIYLRLLTQADASERYVAWLNDEETNRYLETRQVTVDDLKEYIKARQASPNCLFFGIFDKIGDRHIGNVKLEPIDIAKKSAVLGILIGEKSYWGRGIATEATNLIADFCLKDLGLDEITLGVHGANAAAIRVYEKCGFIEFKRDLGAKAYQGQKYDQVWMKKNNIHFYAKK